MNVVAIRGMNDVFELFFVRGEMIVLHTSLMILKKTRIGPKSLNLFGIVAKLKSPKLP